MIWKAVPILGLLGLSKFGELGIHLLLPPLDKLKLALWTNCCNQENSDSSEQRKPIMENKRGSSICSLHCKMFGSVSVFGIVKLVQEEQEISLHQFCSRE